MQTATDRHPFARDLLIALSQSTGVLIAMSLAQISEAATQAMSP